MGGLGLRLLRSWRGFAGGVDGDNVGRGGGISSLMLMFGELMSVDEVWGVAGNAEAL